MKVTIGNRTMVEIKPIQVTIWNEYMQEKTEPSVTNVYPRGIHTAISEGLAPYGFRIQTATLEQPEHGLTDEILNQTDVLIWWGHKFHDKVENVIVERVHNKVLQGMGLIVLHSAHFSKIFKKLMGTSCNLRVRTDNEKEVIWVVNPAHPITHGIGQYIVLQEEEMYGEFFDIPEPDQLVFVGWFEGGEVFRSGCSYYRGLGKVFYFQPGHETNPTYYNKEIMRVIANAVRWAVPVHGAEPVYGPTEPVIEFRSK
ncbi:ThuA domain-containing protein [Paenibacillus sp. LHD-38]|uniref:ThuA domain-containing protein n=1 Tax=Paenibacillus sp. LHD-38 TaxID=3072143 RepID=UPI00280D2B06|nr:ThuA domain-containing protein [Paenibacillus sp. LHD-38]MDQ8737030.1 ThuA domain-containing protein [Paenibacillus sp. LHD-38]